MTAYNAVRMKVKPGQENAFLKAHKEVNPQFKGFLDGALIKTGERSFCIIGRWKSMDHLVAARPQMISLLDTFRPMLEDLGSNLGVTDPVSGEAVVEHGPGPA